MSIAMNFTLQMKYYQLKILLLPNIPYLIFEKTEGKINYLNSFFNKMIKINNKT